MPYRFCDVCNRDTFHWQATGKCSDHMLLSERPRVDVNKHMIKTGNTTQEVVRVTSKVVKPVKKLSHKWTETFIDPNAKVVKPSDSILCLVCKAEISAVTSVYSRLLVRFLKDSVAVTESRPDNPSYTWRKETNVPMYETGYLCRPCFDRAYANKISERNGSFKREAEPIEAPVMRVKEEVRRSGRGRVHSVSVNSRPVRTSTELRQGKAEYKYTTIVVKETEDEIVEWKTNKPEAVKEEIDPKGYAYVFRGRLGRNRKPLKEFNE